MSALRPSFTAATARAAVRSTEWDWTCLAASCCPSVAACLRRITNGTGGSRYRLPRRAPVVAGADTRRWLTGARGGPTASSRLNNGVSGCLLADRPNSQCHQRRIGALPAVKSAPTSDRVHQHHGRRAGGVWRGAPIGRQLHDTAVSVPGKRRGLSGCLPVPERHLRRMYLVVGGHTIASEKFLNRLPGDYPVRGWTYPY